MVTEGDAAPDFELPAHDGGTVSLGSFRNRNSVVLCFYPKNRLFLCPSKKARQLARSMSSSYADIRAAGAVLFAISVDSVRDQARAVKDWNVPYAHLSDASGEVCRMYAGLNRARLARRSTFVVDAGGTIRRIYRNYDPSGHGGEVAEFLRRMERPGGA